MKVIGNGYIHLYGPEDEQSHPPEPDPSWQESVVIYVWDQANGVYAFIRMGHEPQRQQPLSVLWSNIWVPGKYFKYYDYPPFSAGDRNDQDIRVGDICRYRYDGDHHWWLESPCGRVSAEFRMRDKHPGFRLWPEGSGALSDKVAKNHIEASGSVSGIVRFDGETFELNNAIGYRDRSWGLRDWSIMRGHRWLPAIFGDDLSLQAIAWMDSEGQIAHFSNVTIHDEIHFPESTDIVTYAENDCITHRGGRVVLKMASGDTIECLYSPIAPGGVSFHHGFPCVDTLCKVRLQSELLGTREGIGCFEASFNAMGGTRKPNQAGLINGMIENGIFAI
jgi:hypothetical protein